MGFNVRTARMIDRYGQDVEICTDEKTIMARAMIQPMCNSRQHQGLDFMPAGAVDESQFLYIGTGEKGFDKDRVTIIRTPEASYFVEWSEAFRVKNETVYIRAILRICS